jgi:hypothetical protein
LFLLKFEVGQAGHVQLGHKSVSFVGCCQNNWALGMSGSGVVEDHVPSFQAMPCLDTYGPVLQGIKDVPGAVPVFPGYHAVPRAAAN